VLEALGVFFCDDVRQEVNGKFVLIGVYSGEVVVNKFPWVGRLFPILLMKGEPIEIKSVHFTVGTPGGAQFADFRTELESPPSPGGRAPRGGLLPLPPCPITLSGPDEVQIAVSLNDGPANMVGGISVIAAKEPVPQLFPAATD